MKNKYNATKVTYYGKTFASKREGERYLELLDMKLKGEIEDLELQVPYSLLDDFSYMGKKVKGISYIVDFQYITKQGDLVVEDVKGYRPYHYELKKKLFLSRYSHIVFKET